MSQQSWAQQAPTGASDHPDDLVWNRMHPVTPLVRGWGVIVVLLFVMGQQVMGDTEGAADVAASVNPLLLIGAFLLVLLVVGGFSALTWLMMRYAIGSESVHLRKGILFRQQRQARLDRVQAIDIVQPILARLFGLAELRLEVAGGAGSGVHIGFLKISEANALRNDLLARAAGVSVETGQASPAAPEREVLHVRPGMLLSSLLRSGAMIMFLLMVTALTVLAVSTKSFGLLFAWIPGLIGFGAFLWQRFVGEFNFTGAASPDGIRLRRGMLETRAQTIPPGRVQAIRLQQPLLWRSKDWWRVDVTVAGYAGAADGEASSSVLLPVGDRGMALDAIWLVFPDLGTEDPIAVLDEALVGSGASELFTISPRSAFWLDPLSWRRNGFTVTGRGLLIRSGRLVRRLTLVPHERTQSLGLQQGPLQRSLGLTTFALHTTPGPVVPEVRHLRSTDAFRLLKEQDTRARIARESAGPELWMQHVQASAPVPPPPPVPEPHPVPRGAAQSGPQPAPHVPPAPHAMPAYPDQVSMQLPAQQQATSDPVQADWFPTPDESSPDNPEDQR